jgi:hypothetical protein
MRTTQLEFLHRNSSIKKLGSPRPDTDHGDMKRTRAPKSQRSSSGRTRSAKAESGRIHPVIIYPFRHPADLDDLERLYGLVSRLNSEKATYARPITVIDWKTRNTMAKSARHLRFLDKTVAACSDLIQTWSVDTCQMWYFGLGNAFERGRPGDTYWMIPGDFNYGGAVGREVLSRLHDLPEICDELDQDVCIGEIHTDHNNSKQLIDTYGTFALLYNWFPAEAQAIREITERPRSEFFAIRHEFLKEMLNSRWYAYEQTVVILLHAIFSRKRVSRFFVGEISDLPAGKDSLSSAIQQVERTERVFKSLWRELHHMKPEWIDSYRKLDDQSGQLRRTAITILKNLL